MSGSNVMHATTDLSKSKFAAIGRLMVCWGCLEYTYGQVVAQALGLKAKEGRIAMSRLNLRSKHEMLILAARVRGAQNAENDFEEFWKLVTKVQEGRNDMAHSVWFVLQANSKRNLRLVKYRGGKKDVNRIIGKHYKVQTSEIVKLATAADKLVDSLSTLWTKHSGTLVPSSPK